jgi:RNA ligase
MLVINTLQEFRARVQHKEEIREADIGEGCTSFCYMIAAEDTFSDEWARECRGIVFNTAEGFVVGRPLHKFFNVNERESTQVQNLDWSKVTRVMDKRDGSMIHTVWTMNGTRLKSKKSFDSDVAKAAEDWMHSQPGLHVWKLAERMVALDKTAIFEWTAPDARIVLFYPEPELRLLHVRDNATGEYMESWQVREWADYYGVKCVDEVTFDIPNEQLGQHLLDLAKTVEGVEGWVVQFENGDMVKLKTDWYLKRHRAMTFLRERDVAQLVLDEGLDDLKSLLVGDGVDISEVLAVEARVLHDLRELAMAVDLAVAEDKHLDRKSFAIKHNGSEHFGLKMSKYLGKEPSFKEYFERNLLKERYSLRQLVMVDSKAEVE